MKKILTIFVLVLYKLTHGQFAIVADKEGFVNVRSSPQNSKNIIDTLSNGQIVFCFENNGDWIPIEYKLTRASKTGFIHKSRLKVIENFDKIPIATKTDTSISFKSDTLNILLTKAEFIPKKNKLEYNKELEQKDKIRFLEKINGKEFWGTDGNIPKTRYNKIILTLKDKKINLPSDNLYEPHLFNTIVNIDIKTQTIYISSSNSDGAGAYVVLWIIEKGEFKERIVTTPF